MRVRQNELAQRPRCGYIGRTTQARRTASLIRVRTLAQDTSPEAEAVLIRLLRAASPARKIALVLDANRTARILAITRLKAQFPGDSNVRIRRRLADLWLGADLAAKAYGPLGPDE